MALTVEIFKDRAQAIHGERYDYSQFVYTNWDTKSVIVCPAHGPFLQKPRQHIERRSGCPACGKLKQAVTKSIKFDEFIERARAVHGDRYSYDNCGYTTLSSSITIQCPVHGPFVFAHAYAHTINGNGCPKCAHQLHRSTTNDFVTRAMAVHGDYYDYSKSHYVTVDTALTIGCPIHGDQHITPTDHYRVGCWMCKRNRMQDVWLDSIGLPNTKEHRQVRLFIFGKLHVVDGFDPVTNTVFLFHGDFWHGNPKLYSRDDINRRNMKTFGELYDRTIQYENRISEAGYQVVSIWENTWLQQ